MDSHGFARIFIDFSWIFMDLAWIWHGFPWVWHGCGMGLDAFALPRLPLWSFWAPLERFVAFGGIWGHLGSVGAKIACHDAPGCEIMGLFVICCLCQCI